MSNMELWSMHHGIQATMTPTDADTNQEPQLSAKAVFEIIAASTGMTNPEEFAKKFLAVEAMVCYPTLCITVR